MSKLVQGHPPCNSLLDRRWTSGLLVRLIFGHSQVVRPEVNSGRVTPLVQYGFWRLVLDEGQVVANSAGRAACSVSRIMRRHAWVVTGNGQVSLLHLHFTNTKKEQKGHVGQTHYMSCVQSPALEWRPST